MKHLCAFRRKFPAPLDEETDADSTAKNNSTMIKKKCRTKLDLTLKLLADAVPGALDSICWKKPFRNQILNSAVKYISGLEEKLKTLQAEVTSVDQKVDQLLCNNKTMEVEETVLEEMRRVLAFGACVSPNDPQVKMMNQMIGAKAFLVRRRVFLPFYLFTRLTSVLDVCAAQPADWKALFLLRVILHPI